MKLDVATKLMHLNYCNFFVYFCYVHKINAAKLLSKGGGDFSQQCRFFTNPASVN